MAEQSQSEFMTSNNPYSALPTRAQNETLFAYLQRLAKARGGMMLGTNSPVVDDVIAEEITSQPLGELIKNIPQGDGGEDNNRDTRTPEQRKTDTMERAVGLLSGTAASAIGLGSIAGPAGMALGAFADYDTVKQFENQLEQQGYTPQQIEQIKENPSMLQQGLQTGPFGVVSKGYEPNLVDKFSITGLFSDIFGDDSPAYSGPNVPGITSLANVQARTPTYAGAVNYAAPFQTQGLLTGQQPFNVTPGFGTVLAPGNYGTSSNSGGDFSFGATDNPTVSQGTTGGFFSGTFDDVANDSSWGGGNDGGNDSGGNDSGGTDHGFGPGNDDGWD